MREMLVASKTLSEYMHFAIKEKHENIWIAQRAGRAKDSNDRTSDGVLKMMTMGGTGSVTDKLKSLHIVPLTISYEYDPCDFLKAKEFQQKRDNPQWKKAPTDDIVSMQTGIMGYKGHVHYQCAPCIDTFLDNIPADTPKGDLYRIIADHIDHEIHRNYWLYPSNYIALDELHGTETHKEHYTDNDKAFFDRYISQQIEKIDLTDKDGDYLRKCILTMYANPAINHLAAIKE